MPVSSPLLPGVQAYATAASASLLPSPKPLYAKAASEDPIPHALDICWRLIQLSAEADSVAAGDGWKNILTQLLRPAGYTPQRLDCLLAWQVLQVLHAAGILQSANQPSPKQVTGKIWHLLYITPTVSHHGADHISGRHRWLHCT